MCGAGAGAGPESIAGGAGNAIKTANLAFKTSIKRVQFDTKAINISKLF